MRFRRLVSLVGLTGCLTAFANCEVPAHAEQSDRVIVSSMPTSAVVNSCRNAGDVNRVDCSGYLMGVFDAMSLSRSICPPTTRGITGQAIAVALKYLNDNPQEWHHGPAYVIGQGFQAAFPCRKNPT
jgi:hypothetical protein